MSSPGAPASAPNRRQKRMGPAPFASFEDLSDELDSPEDKNTSGSVVRLPGIREDATPCSPAPSIKPEFCYTGISIIGAPSTPTVTTLPQVPNESNSKTTVTTTTTLQTPCAPRIDISRASSSSHHDSKDSSPERDEAAKLGMEEGALDLRLSTEELDFQEQQQQQRIIKQQQRAHSPTTMHEDSYHSHNRKDSQSSEIGLLCISGRTSRLSSIGSQGSAHSRISNASHLSVISGQSGLSRSPSPHKMLLETSFCGTKPHKRTPASADKDEGTKDDLEKVLLKRQHDPTQVLIAEGITVEKPKEVERPPPEKPARQKLDAQKITIKVDKPGATSTNDILKPKLPKRFVSESGVEYIYIPLKGPLPEDNTQPTNGTVVTKPKVRETKSATLSAKPAREPQKQKSKSASPSPVVSRHHHQSSSSSTGGGGDEPKYIRIKLKPDHMYDDTDDSSDLQKPISLNLEEPTISASKPQTFEEIIAASPQYSTPKLPKHLKEPPAQASKSPSPSLSRKSSFASIFKSRETISPESPTLPGGRRKNTHSTSSAHKKELREERRRSRSKSRDRTSLGPSSTESIDSKGKPKSMFSLFKSKKGSSQRDLDRASPELPNLESLMMTEHCHKKTKMKLKTEAPLDADSVRIPLHSPTYYEQKSILSDFKTSSQDSQDTVIEVKPSSQTAVQQQEVAPGTPNQSVQNTRQNSTSSENLVFSTKLGSNNDIFTTKFPKDKYVREEEENTTTAIVEPEPPPKLQPSTTTTPFHSQPTTPILAKTKIVESPGEKRKPVVVSLETKPSKSPNDEPTVSSVTMMASSSDVVTTTVEKCGDTAQQQQPTTSNRSRVLSKEDHNSSESEHEFDAATVGSKDEEPELIEPERKGLFLQQDSYEDEFPYIPTTLPQERSVAVPIVPIKERSNIEMRTIPVERPRSTTPLNPTFLEEYREDAPAEHVDKIKISLPREEKQYTSSKKPLRSPRRNGSEQWFDFSKLSSTATAKEDVPPPLPPKGVQKEWINFEEIPEKRKPPKRIQTIPSRGNIEVPDAVLQENVIYTYVNPEDCKCECHERATPNTQQQQHQSKQQQQHQHGAGGGQQEEQEEEESLREDELPLLEDDPNEESEKLLGNVEKIKLDVTILDRRSIVSDSSVDLSTSVDPNGISLQTPFTSDLGVSSNRSSIISQEDAQSPDTDSPNAFPKTT